MKTKKTALIALLTALILLLSCSIGSASFGYQSSQDTNSVSVSICYPDHTVSFYVISAVIAKNQSGYIKINDTTTYNKLVAEMAAADGKKGKIIYCTSHNTQLVPMGDFAQLFTPNKPVIRLMLAPVSLNSDGCQVTTYKIDAAFVKQ